MLLVRFQTRSEDAADNDLCSAVGHELRRRRTDLVTITSEELGYKRCDAELETDLTIAALETAAQAGETAPSVPQIEGTGAYAAVIVAGNVGASCCVDLTRLAASGCRVDVRLSSRHKRLRTLLQEAYEATTPSTVIFSDLDGPAFVEEVISGPADVLLLWGTYETALTVERRVVEAGKRFFFEGPGSDPVLVLEGADIEATAAAIAETKFLFSGQQCVAPERVYCISTRYEELCDALYGYFHRAMAGPVDDETTRIGPLMAQKSVSYLLHLLKDAKSKGARVLTGGSAEGSLMDATLVIDAHPTMRGMQEELFGPVLYVMSVESAEQAIHQARLSPYGLSASVWGVEAETAASTLRGAPYLEKVPGLTFGKFGVVAVDSFAFLEPIDLLQPFGGYGKSGWVTEPLPSGGVTIRQGPKSAVVEATRQRSGGVT